MESMESGLPEPLGECPLPLPPYPLRGTAPGGVPLMEGTPHTTPLWITQSWVCWGFMRGEPLKHFSVDLPPLSGKGDSWRGGGRESPPLLGPRTIMDRLGFPSSPWPHHPPQSCAIVPSREVVENIWVL